MKYVRPNTNQWYFDGGDVIYTPARLNSTNSVLTQHDYTICQVESRSQYAEGNARHIAWYDPRHTDLIEAVITYARRLSEANVHGYNYDTSKLENALGELDVYRTIREKDMPAVGSTYTNTWG